MPKSLTSLDAHTSDIIEERRNAKDARFKPAPQGVERVEDVLRQAIDFLQSHLQSSGFKAAPSQLSVSRKIGEITQVVRLRPAPGNLSGVNVNVSAEALVKSTSFKRWTRTEGTGYAREILWIHQLGYLSGKNDYFKWQLADASVRDQELADLLQKVRTLALPAFDAWANKPAIGSAVFRLTEVDRIDWLVETALWSGNRFAAEQLIQQYLNAHSRDVSTYVDELARFRADPSIREPKPSFASGMAFLVARHALGVNHAG